MTKDDYEMLNQERLDLLSKRGKPHDYSQDEFKAMGLRLAEINTLLARGKQELGMTPSDVRQAHRQRARKNKSISYQGQYTPEYVEHCLQSYLPLWKHELLRPRLLQQYWRMMGVKLGLAKGVLAFEEKYLVFVPHFGDLRKYLEHFTSLMDVPITIKRRTDSEAVHTWKGENDEKDD